MIINQKSQIQILFVFLLSAIYFCPQHSQMCYLYVRGVKVIFTSWATYIPLSVSVKKLNI